MLAHLTEPNDHCHSLPNSCSRLLCGEPLSISAHIWQWHCFDLKIHFFLNIKFSKNKNENIHKNKFNKSDDQTNIDNIELLLILN